MVQQVLPFVKTMQKVLPEKSDRQIHALVSRLSKCWKEYNALKVKLEKNREKEHLDKAATVLEEICVVMDGIESHQRKRGSYKRGTT